MLEEWIGEATAEYRLIVEVYVALENGAPTLAAMGVRAIIETIMINTVGDQGSFKNNLVEMKDKGWISQIDVNNLTAVIDVGSAAIHRGHRPSLDDTIRALDIAEILVKRVHLDKNAILALKKSTPSRRPKGDA